LTRDGSGYGYGQITAVIYPSGTDMVGFRIRGYGYGYRLSISVTRWAYDMWTQILFSNPMRQPPAPWAVGRER
jgi:hypothetical protein